MPGRVSARKSKNNKSGMTNSYFSKKGTIEREADFVIPNLLRLFYEDFGWLPVDNCKAGDDQ